MQMFVREVILGSKRSLSARPEGGSPGGLPDHARACAPPRRLGSIWRAPSAAALRNGSGNPSRRPALRPESSPATSPYSFANEPFLLGERARSLVMTLCLLGE